MQSSRADPGSYQSACRWVSHQPSSRLPLLSARPAVTLATLNRAATNFTAWWTEAWWVWTVCWCKVPLLMATSAFGVGRRCWSSQQHYQHCRRTIYFATSLIGKQVVHFCSSNSRKHSHQKLTSMQCRSTEGQRHIIKEIRFCMQLERHGNRTELQMCSRSWKPSHSKSVIQSSLQLLLLLIHPFNGLFFRTT